MEIRCEALEIRRETKELEKFISVCVWGDPSLISSCVYFLETCWDSWWGRTWRNVFAQMLDDGPGRKLTLREETVSIWSSRRDLGYWPSRGEKETFGQFMLSPGSLPPPPPAPPPPPCPQSASHGMLSESRRMGWRVKIESFKKLCKTYLQNSIVTQSLQQRYRSRFCVENSGFGGLRTPEDTLQKLQVVNTDQNLVTTELRVRRWSSREVAAVLNGNQRSRRAHGRTPRMGLRRREVEEK